MSAAANRKLLLDVFRAIEQRDDKRFRELLHPDFELHWPPSLPYGGSKARTWSETWEAFQPDETERRMDPRVVAAGEDEGVVLWRQRGISPSGERLRARCSASINSVMESWPAPRCFTSTLWRWRISSRRPRAVESKGKK